MKLLIKRAFKSIFRNKFFMALMFILVALSGATFTILDSSSNSFKQSYNNVVVDGNLHDAVVKENFKVEQGSTFELGMYDNTNTIVEINEANLPNAQQFVSASDYKVKLGIIDQKGSYSDIDLQNVDPNGIYVNFKNNGDGSLVDEVTQIQEKANSWKADLISDAESKLSDQFTDVINQIYGITGTNELVAQNTKSLSVTVPNTSAGTENAYKLVRTNPNDSVNKLIMNDGTNKFTQMRTEEEMKEEILDQLRGRGLKESDYTFNTLKGYSISASSAAGTGDTIKATDPSGFEAIVSPAYANANGIKAISPIELVNLYNQDRTVFENLDKNQAVLNKYKDSIVRVDQTPYFVIGIGTRPDFSYPIIDEQHPTVDVENQAVLFVNDRGYERAVDAWRTNPREDYISLKYNDNVSVTRQHIINDEISDILRNGNAATHISKETRSKFENVTNSGVVIPKSFFPQDVEVVTYADDPNDVMLLVQERTSVLNTLQGTISSLSRATTFLLVLFVASIVILVFNVLISINRKSLATLMALGHSKTRIAFSTAFISLAIGLLPTAIGYLAGFGSQYAFINSFEQFWTLPAYGDPFSWVSLVVVVGVPFLLLGLLIFVIVLAALRHPVPNMLKESVKEENPYTAKVVSKFKFMGPKGRYSVALMFKNSGKLVLVGLTMTISLISLMVGFSTSGAAAQAYNATSRVNDYNYRIDLFSPTEEGGEYTRLLSNDEGGLITPSNQLATTYGIGSNVDTTQPHWHVPSTDDSLYGMPAQAADPNNLYDAAHYLENKLQVKALLDSEVVTGMNPWNIAARLMPENQLNTANIDAKEFEDYFKTSGLSKIDAFKNWLMDDSKDIPYIISYKTVVTDPTDNEYTYLDTDFNIGDSSYTYRITGLQNNEDIVIPENQLNGLNTYAASNPNKLPILINRYMAEYLGLGVGDTFNAIIKNDMNRNFKNHQTHNVDVVVLGIVEGYDDGGIYTTQDIANKLIGFDEDGFNGIFANEEDSSLLNTLPLYSPSGLYLGTDTIIGDWETKVLTAILADPNIWKYGNDITNNVDEFVGLYSRTPFVSMTSSVHWQALNKNTFKNTSDLTNTMIWLVEAISISISVIFMSIVSLLLFVSNRKKIATLWTLGYRRREIIKIFLGTYIIPLLIAIAIAVPASFGILFGMRAFIMGFGHILIPLSLTIWAPFVSIVVVSAIFIVATVLSVLTQRPDKNLAAFKE